MFFSKKFFLKISQDTYIDFQTGKTLSALGKEGEKVLKDIRSGIVIEYVDPKTRRYLVRARSMSMNYIYFDDESRKYYLASELDTSFIGKVLQLKYKESAFVVYGNRAAIFFYGDNTCEFYQLKHNYSSKEGKEEAKSYSEGVFQGVSYREVPIGEVYSLVSPSKKKLFFAIGFLVLFLLYFAFSSLGGGEEKNGNVTIPVFSPSKEEVNEKFPPVKIPKQIKRIYSTNMALREIANFKPEPLSIVGGIEFTGNEQTLREYFFYPAIGTTKEGVFYVRDKRLVYPSIEELKIGEDGSIPDIRKVIGLRSRASCMYFYRNLDVVSNDKEKTIFSLSRVVSTDTVEKLIEGSIGCPVAFDGNLLISGTDISSMDSGLTITLYNYRDLWKKYHTKVEERNRKIQKWKDEEQRSMIKQARRLLERSDD